jgi:hypothetical protein
VRATERGIGEDVDEPTSYIIDNSYQVALLELVLRLLGATDQTPEPLDRQVGIRAAIEATGDREALRLYEHWRTVRTRTGRASG